jgi:hypothetical protein
MSWSKSSVEEKHHTHQGKCVIFLFAHIMYTYVYMYVYIYIYITMHKYI